MQTIFHSVFHGALRLTPFSILGAHQIPLDLNYLNCSKFFSDKEPSFSSSTGQNTLTPRGHKLGLPRNKGATYLH